MAELNARRAAVMGKIIDAEGKERDDFYAPSLDEEPEVEELLQMKCIVSEIGGSGYQSLQPGRAASARYLRSKQKADS